MTARRLVVFVEPASFVAKTLLGAVLKACRRRSDFDVVAVCDAGRRPGPRRSATRTVGLALVRRLFDPAHTIVVPREMWRTLRDVAGPVPLITPPERDINDPQFIERLRGDLRPDDALSLICMQIFGADLLATFRTAVNYHNGALPAYRGLRATAWSVYRGEATTGFTFHRMTRRIDDGPVIVGGAVEVRPDASVLKLEREKTALAAAAVHDALDAMAADAEGTPQHGPAGYYSRDDVKRIATVADPSDVTWDDLSRRVRAFTTVRLGRDALPVTKVERAPNADGPLVFRTADGVRARATRLRFLPVPLYERLRA